MLPTPSAAVHRAPAAELRFSECGGRGLCDRATGACACFAGLEGAACGTVVDDE